MTKHCIHCLETHRAAADWEAIAASECAENVILEQALTQAQSEASHWKAAHEAAIQINAKQAQHIRALRTGEVVKS